VCRSVTRLTLRHDFVQKQFERQENSSLLLPQSQCETGWHEGSVVRSGRKTEGEKERGRREREKGTEGGVGNGGF